MDISNFPIFSIKMWKHLKQKETKDYKIIYNTSKSSKRNIIFTPFIMFTVSIAIILFLILLGVWFNMKEHPILDILGKYIKKVKET